MIGRDGCFIYGNLGHKLLACPYAKRSNINSHTQVASSTNSVGHRLRDCPSAKRSKINGHTKAATLEDLVGHPTQ